MKASGPELVLQAARARWPIGAVLAAAARRSRPLSGYLFLLSLGIALPLLILAGMLAVTYATRERARIERDAIAMASDLTDAVDRELSGLLSTMTVLAATPYLQEGRLDDFDALARALSPKIGANIVVRDRSHQQLVNTRLPRGAPLPVNTDFEGDKRVLASGRAEISDVFIGGVTRTPLVMVNAPVFKDGEIRYFVNPSIAPERIRDVLLTQSMPEGWTGTVADRKGVIVARSRAHESFVGKPGAPGLMEQAAKQPQGVWRGVDVAGVETAFAYKRSPLSGWLVVAGVPVAQLAAPLRQAWWTLAALALLLISLSIAIASIMGRWLSRSIVALADAGEALTANAPIEPLSSPIEEVAAVHRTLTAAFDRRQHNEQRLRESEARLRLFVEHAPASIAMLDRDLRYVAASRRWRDDFRLDADPIGRLHYELSPEVHKRWKEVHRRALAGEVLFAEEDPFVRADGSTQYLRWECRPWYGADGQIAGLLIGTEDETPRVLARQESARLAAIVTSSADAIISKTLDGTITSWNAAAERLFGYSANEMIGQSIRRLFPPERVVEEDMILTRISTGETVDRFETVRVTKDGRTIDVAVTVSPIRDGSGRVVGASKIVRDITERKRAEAALAEQRRLYKTVTDNAATALFIMDERHQCVFMNPSAERMTGYTLAETRGRPLHDVVHHTRPDGTPYPLSECPIDQAFPKNDREQGEEVFVHKDGRFYHVAFTASPMPGPDGTPVGTVIEVQDISLRKSHESQLVVAAQRAEIAQQAAKAMNYEFVPKTDEVVREAAVFESLTGYGHEVPASGEGWRSIIHPDDADAAWAAIGKGIESGAGFVVDYRIRHKAGHFVWVHDHAAVIKARDGASNRVIGMVIDISELKAREQQVFLLMKEVNHRAKNMLGLVQAIARQTAASDPKTFVQRFGERIQAMSANQDLLVNNGWTGVGAHELVRAQLAPFQDLIGSRICIKGPDLRFNPAAAQALGLALHELSTNAGKYGALSDAAGRVDIGWRLDGEVLTFEWKERHGPPVAAPVREGFGSTVLKSLAKMTVYGEVETDYAPAGFRWQLTCPADKAIEHEAAGSQH